MKEVESYNYQMRQNMLRDFEAIKAKEDELERYASGLIPINIMLCKHLQSNTKPITDRIANRLTNASARAIAKTEQKGPARN